MKLSNEQLIEELRRRLQSGELDSQALQSLLAEPSTTTVGSGTEFPGSVDGTERSLKLPAFSLTRLLYVVGGLLVVLGIGYLMSQLWADMGSTLRIVSTLGFGLMLAGIGSVFLVAEPEREVGTVFHTIGGLMIPGGAMVMLAELLTNDPGPWTITGTVGMVFLFYLLLTLYHRRVILSFFTIANGTVFIYLFVNALLPTATANVYAYLTMWIGISYVLFGWTSRSDWNERLVPVLYFFGPLGFYLAAFSRIFEVRAMELLFPFLGFGGMALAVAVLRSRTALVLSTLAVISYIIYFTAEYFADSIGWPVALIVLGFVVIGLGYASVSLNRRFLAPHISSDSG